MTCSMRLKIHIERRWIYPLLLAVWPCIAAGIKRIEADIIWDAADVVERDFANQPETLARYRAILPALPRRYPPRQFWWTAWWA